jgi:hypothetical protein
MKVCAITNVFNEKRNLPVWLGHYGRQLGYENCIILDHGSDDGSTNDLKGAGRVYLPRRTKFNEDDRIQLITELANNLLNYYDAVLYTDCDEMLVADPRIHANLVSYCEQMTRPVAHAIGLNVRHNIQAEPPLDNDRPILEQRTTAQFVGSMCKPLIIKEPVSWGGGFHCCMTPPSFDDLYLFHLRYVDKDWALERLAVTRQIKFARDGAATHQQRADDELISASFGGIHRFKVDENFDLSAEIKQHLDGVQKGRSGRYVTKPFVFGRILHRIPVKFRSIF